jgi:hypothetical protein
MGKIATPWIATNAFTRFKKKLKTYISRFSSLFNLILLGAFLAFSSLGAG